MGQCLVDSVLLALGESMSSIISKVIDGKAEKGQLVSW